MDFPLLTLVPLYYLYANAVLWDTVTLNFEKKIHKDTHEKKKIVDCILECEINVTFFGKKYCCRVNRKSYFSSC